MPRDRDVILACAVGVRSLKATYFLMYQGYDRVMNMNPGIARWVAKGFPVTGSAEAAAARCLVAQRGGSADAARDHCMLRRNHRQLILRCPHMANAGSCC